MPSVDPKPQHRPFRRVLYREDSTDSTVIKDVTPRSFGRVLKKLPKINYGELTDRDRFRLLNNASTKLLINEGAIYRTPDKKIKYFKRIPNNPMSHYLFKMQKYNHSSLGIATLPENPNFT